MLGCPGADFLREVAFWSIRTSVLGAALRMTWPHFLVRSSQLCSRLSLRNDPFLREVSQNCFLFNVVKCCQLRKLRKSRRILSFLMLSSSKTEEVSQNCFVFDVVSFEEWGSLAEFFRFWRCQVQKLRKSRRIAAFLMLSISKTEVVSWNSFVFKLADRHIDR